MDKATARAGHIKTPAHTEQGFLKWEGDWIKKQNPVHNNSWRFLW